VKAVRKLTRRFFLFCSVVFVLLLGLLAVDFAFLRGRTPKIAGSSTSIASLERITLGGVEQWILIRGWRVSDPVVLFLHGGPGMPAMYLAHDFQRELERNFVIVHWDRRGAGKSYRSGVDGDISVRQTIDDTFELTRLLCRRLNKDRIYLVGHSFGSYFGMLAAWEHPEHYLAYIGMGQMTDGANGARAIQAQRRFLLQKGREAGDDELVKRLAAPGTKAAEKDLFRYRAELFRSTNWWPIAYSGLTAPEYTLADILNLQKGVDMVARKIKMRMNAIPGPLAECVSQVRIPVYFFLGRHDYNTPSLLAEEYFHLLQAPLKKLVWFENSAHMPFFEEPEFFRRQMIAMDRGTMRFWTAQKKKAHD
jgi:pimeloyl-ACP methyl ester carboxylesterase